MSTVAHLPVISPDPQAAEKLQAELLARKASVEIIFQAGFDFAVEAMTPPPPRPHLRLVTLDDVTAASVTAIREASPS